MKRTLKYALSAVLGAALVIPALAQDQFPDVPANHWAYKDLLEMKQNGLLVGYPDGLFRGGRPASRYELAVACHAVWANLKAQQDALKSQMDDLARRMDGVATKADLDALKAQLDALSAEVNRIKSEDIARLNRLLDEFRGELTRMGADVNQMKSDIKAIGDRLTKVEARLPNFDVTGDLNFLALGGYSSSHRNGVTVDDRPTGVGRGSYTGDTVGATRDLTALYEGAFTVKSHHEEDKKGQPEFHVTGVYGNMLGQNQLRGVTAQPLGGPSFQGSPFGNQSWVLPGRSFGEGDPSWYFQDFYVRWDTSIGGQKFNAEVGRVNYKISPYIFQRPDNTPYFANERWDNGKWTFDGGILGFGFGSTKLDVFGGRTSSFRDSNGLLVQQMWTGRDQVGFIPGETRPRGFQSNMVMVDQFLGAHLAVPLSSNGKLNLSYLMLDSNDVVTTGTTVAPRLVNGTAVYGGDLRFKFKDLSVMGSYQKSDLHYSGHSVSTTNDAAWTIGFNYMKEKKFEFGAGYRRIDPMFSAPGAWGRIGIWWNPTDIQGFQVHGAYDFTDKFWIGGSAAWYTGTGERDRFGDRGLSTDDRLNHYRLDLGYQICPKTTLKLGWEEADWSLRNNGNFIGGKPREMWWNVGLDCDLGNRAKLSFMWQVSDYNSHNVFGFNPFPSGSDSSSNGTRATGGLLSTQLSIKF